MAASVLAITIPTRASAEAMLLIEVDSGKVLHAENATYPWYPASVTKVLTAYVTLTAVKERRLTLDSLLPVSARAAAQAPSKMGFKPGTTVTVDNALKMLMVKSANDVAYVLAEGVGGSVEKFADEMNETSRRLGMTQSNWVNPNGLPAENQITSARDLAILGRAMVRDYPEIFALLEHPGDQIRQEGDAQHQLADRPLSGRRWRQDRIYLCLRLQRDGVGDAQRPQTDRRRSGLAVIAGARRQDRRHARTRLQPQRRELAHAVARHPGNAATDCRGATRSAGTNVRQAPQAACRRGCRRRHASRQQQPIRSQFTCRIHAVEPGAGVRTSRTRNWSHRPAL